jgi:hypothetical protein
MLLPAAWLQQRQSGKKAALVLRSSLIMVLGMRLGTGIKTKAGQTGNRFLKLILQADNLYHKIYLQLF